jgi:hypothetical protein
MDKQEGAFPTRSARRPKRGQIRPSVLWRLERIAFELDVSRRVLERLRSSGGFPPPDKVIGTMPLWKPETVRAWVEAQGNPA